MNGLPTAQGVTVFVLDDVGRVDIEQLVGDGRAPNLARLVREGFSFTQAHAMPLCQPSRRSLDFGDYSVTFAGTGCQTRRDPDAPSLAARSLAEEIGVPDLYLGKWHEGRHPTSAAWERAPQAHGWDDWRGGVAGIVTACGGVDYSTWLEVDRGSARFSFEYQPSVQLRRWLAWYPFVRGPRLVVYATPLAHSPYHRPPSEWLPPGYPATPTPRDQYEAMIVAADRALGVMLALARPSDSIVVVGDNGTPQDVAGTSKAKGTTYRRGVEVPLILWGPRIPQGSSAALVHLVDVYPTVAEIFGLPEDRARDGRSLFPLMLRQVATVHEVLLLGSEGHTLYPDDLALRSERYKLRRLADGREEFYDLAVDPGEEVDRVAEAGLADEVARHRAWLERELLDAR